jgi:hypothetical protein
MPTLERRNDGCYYVRHFFREHSTWQVLGEGVHSLGNRGVKEGSWLSTNLFMELWTRRLVYHGNSLPTGPLPDSRDAAAVTGLRKRAADFYRLVYSGQVQTAWEMVRDDEHTDAVPESFTSDVNRLEVS